MRSSSELSVWDGFIIPHCTGASPTNQVFNTLWFFKKNVYAETTIETVGKRLRQLETHCVLGEPEQMSACECVTDIDSGKLFRKRK